jgi:hypothetical protein
MGQDQDRVLFAKDSQQALQTLPRIQGGEVAPICARPNPSGAPQKKSHRLVCGVGLS